MISFEFFSWNIGLEMSIPSETASALMFCHGEKLERNVVVYEQMASLQLLWQLVPGHLHAITWSCKMIFIMKCVIVHILSLIYLDLILYYICCSRVTKNPGTANIMPYNIQVYQWQHMYMNTFHNKNHLTTSSYCVQMPWHQLSQQLERRHLLTNHHISFKFFSMTKHQGTGRLTWNRHFKANIPWEKLERNHKSITP